MNRKAVILSLPFILLLATTCLAQKQSITERTVRLDRNAEVVISNYKGCIDVDTWNRPEARVTVTVRSDGDERAVEETEVKIDDSSRSRLLIGTETESRSGGILNIFGTRNRPLPLVQIQVTIPEDARVVIDDYKSDIRISGLREEARVETYKGSLRGKALSGGLNVSTYKGKVEVADVEGPLRIDTYKGHVIARFAVLDDDVDLETYKGEIELVLPSDAAFNVEADGGRRGDVTSDFEYVAQARSGWLRGQVNGGGPVIRFETNKGSLALTKL